MAYTRVVLFLDSGDQIPLSALLAEPVFVDKSEHDMMVVSVENTRENLDRLKWRLAARRLNRVLRKAAVSCDQ